MKGYLLSLAGVLATSFLPGVAEAGTKYNFNSDWRLYAGDATDAQNPGFDDSSWDSVTLPHAWNEDDAFRVSIANLSTGIAWYRKSFNVPSSNGKYFLEFEGIRFAGEFYLNGEWIGRSENGIMAFGFDVTAQTLPNATNVVAAKIDNAWDYQDVTNKSTFQWNDKNFYPNYGGINKNVYLHHTDRLFQTLPLYSNLNTTGVYVYAQDIDVGAKSAVITAESEIRNDYQDEQTFTYAVTITDQDGNTVKEFSSGPFTVGGEEFITVNASSSVSDLHFWSWGYGYLYTVETSVIRDSTTMDKVSTTTGFRKTGFSDGIFTLNDRALHLKGYAQRSPNEWPALGNSVPAWLSDFSNRLILQANGNLVRWMHVTPWKQDIESLDRLGILQAMPAGDSEGDVTGVRWNQRKNVMRDAIIYNKNNPSIVFYESGNHGISEEHMQEMKDLRNTFDPYGGRAAGSREMLNSTVAEYGGEMLYVNKHTTFPVWQMEYSRDEGLRRYWDNYTAPYHPDQSFVLSYDRNQDSLAIESVVRWFEYYDARPGQGKRVNSGGAKIIFADSNSHYRGSQNYRTSGDVDPVRLPKDAYYTHQVMWNNWVDIDSTAVHIIGHWNYNESTTKDVYVVSTADQVELTLNGESLGFGVQSNRFLFTFAKVTWQSGVLAAYGYVDGSEEAAAQDNRTTTGAAAAIRLTPQTSPNGFQASGADIALVDVEVVDSHGKRVPTALNTIDFTLTGEAEWRGGIAVGQQDNYILSESLPVENGINRVLLRSTTTAGQVTLTASSDGLTEASIELDTVAVESENGLSTVLPSSGLAGELTRGETPSGASYVEKRTTLTVSSVEAGSNPDTVKNSFDDNEETVWSSSSTTGQAWIQYKLAEEATINAVVIKFKNIRDTHGVTISVDDEVAWSGRSLYTLGYWTASFNETVGSLVKIASTSGELALNEVEIYGPV